MENNFILQPMIISKAGYSNKPICVHVFAKDQESGDKKADEFNAREIAAGNTNIQWFAMSVHHPLLGGI